eukprot:scaffold67801_cov55-Phaeocystis_antarctica.AAC.3
MVVVTASAVTTASTSSSRLSVVNSTPSNEVMILFGDGIPAESSVRRPVDHMLAHTSSATSLRDVGRDDGTDELRRGVRTGGRKGAAMIPNAVPAAGVLLESAVGHFFNGVATV